MPSLSLHDLPLSNTVNEVLAQCPAETAGLPITVLPIPGRGEIKDNHHDTPRIFVAQQGHGLRWASREGVTRSMHTAPRMIEIYEQGLTFQRSLGRGAGTVCAR